DVLGIGEEEPLAHDVGKRVQMAVDRLEAEVRHPDGVGVRVDEGDRDLPTPVLAHGALLVGEESLELLLESPGHQPSLPCATQPLITPSGLSGSTRTNSSNRR